MAVVQAGLADRMQTTKLHLCLALVMLLENAYYLGRSESTLLHNRSLKFSIFKLSEFKGELTISGRLVKSGTLEFSSLKSVISLDGLADGTYILNVDELDFHELLIIQQ